MEEKRTLYRDTDDKILGGVASGLAAFCNWDISVMRFAFVLGWLSIPSFTLAYILAWIIVPGKYNPSGGLGFGKILLLLIIIGLPMILFTLLFGAMILSMFATIL